MDPASAAPRGKAVENGFDFPGVEVFVEILADLHHRCVDAGAEALDLHPAENAICRDLAPDGRDVQFLSASPIPRASRASSCTPGQEWRPTGARLNMV